MTHLPKILRTLPMSVAAALLLAGPASAKPQHPLELLETIQKLSNKSGPQRIKRRVKDKQYDAMLSLLNATYGEPKQTRSGLSIWEVENPDIGIDSAPVVTVMIGRDDAKRRALLVIDDRAASRARGGKRGLKGANQNGDAFPRVDVAPPPPMPDTRARGSRGSDSRRSGPDL